MQTPETDARLSRFKIADFGLSVLLADGVELSRPPDPWAHLPPELLQSGFRSPNSRCDLYGLGITLPLELVARQGRED